MSTQNGHYGYDRSSSVVVLSTGTVYWGPLSILHTTCPINVQNYPYDKQICPITIEYFETFSSEINLTVLELHNPQNQFNTHLNYIESSEWHMQEFVCFRNETKLMLINQSKTQSKITCLVKVQRRALFYVFNFVMPCLLLLVLGVISFCMDSSDRVSFTTTLLLSMMVFLLVLLDSMPPTATVIPLMGE